MTGSDNYHQHGKIQVQCRNIIEQPLDEQFDLIMSAMAVHHVQDTGKMLARFAKHLKPGTQIALAVKGAGTVC